MNRRTELAAIVFILLVAAGLRFHRLAEIPPGLTHDEADVGHFALNVLNGVREDIASPQGYIHEPFVHYSGAAFMLVFGPNDFALRAHAAFWGLMVVLFGYAWARRAFDAPTALLTAGLIAVSYWPVATSRQAHNFMPVPALFAAGAYFIWRALFGWERWRAPAAWGAAVASITASLYSYESSRAVFLALPIFWLYLALTRQAPRAKMIGFALAIGAILALTAPHLAGPVAWGRTNTLAEPLRALRAGDWKPIAENALSGLATFTMRGDPLVTYNLPGRPIFDPVTGALFYVGMGLCVWRAIRGNAVSALAIVWFAFGIAPTLIIGAYTSTLHSSATQAIVFTFPAAAAVTIARRFLFSRRFGHGVAIAAVAGLALTAGMTYRDYFLRWGTSRETRAAYFADLAAAADYLRDRAVPGAAAVSSPFPTLPLDPFVGDLRIRRRDLELRWFDDRAALVLPTVDSAEMIVVSSAPLDPILADRVNVTSRQSRPEFDALTWDPLTTLRRWEADASFAEMSPSPNFGGAVELTGHDVIPAAVAPGSVLRFASLWRILDPSALGPMPAGEYGVQAAITLRLVAPDSVIVAQQDTLGVPAWNWHSGDAFAQLHALQLPAILRAGQYRLTIGVYAIPSRQPLHLVSPGAGVSNDLVELGTVNVAP
ncbi:MAG: glycosyltransferase family 39 protein [Chloroflexi bacterium]|nr:glycosyltransferase family 39 protein [Chloroflexota bacterium]